ncbi:MAG TPA: phenylalanine--tRNA ligase subunit alpha [Usitatibacteraceae bacterium]|jgi:phenylalanyl-tRNA synthetase alpha chain|nr:phenylalanine--tRNA ligase subunit alpha [Usitatibacteraceae bacterium]HQY47460.1 phenylalanine--tRNA ligase subunit alpha [Usitatibacteraceae bacterium]
MQAIDKIIADAQAAFDAAPTVAELEQAKSRFLGKSGALTELLKGLGKLPAEEKPKAGAAINEAKVRVEGLLAARRDAILAAELEGRLAAESVDVTLPGRRQSGGGLHPISRAQERIEFLFASMGFSVADGPEIENDFYNFTALRMFPDHPSRSMQDTFYVADSDKVLRTHTSPVQIRYMQSHEPPIRIICPGRVYRVDHDATHSPMFHQIEGLWVDEGVSLADLKGTVTQFCRAFFERDDIAIRFRPSYFPFVEPGVEIDMEWERKDGEVKYLEIGGAGVVHPDVLRNGNIDPERYSGFAFGMGLDRLAMLKYGVNDLRLFFDNDLKFLRQFR